MPTLKGRMAVKEYYKTAPLIVEAVIEREKSNVPNVWHSVYKDILKAVGLIVSKRYERAFETYRQLTLGLQRGYLD